jgi:hypothetical protein
MLENFELPASLQDIFFPFRWDKQALWALKTPTTLLPLDELSWHLDLPVWSTQPPQPLFNLRPREVILQPALHAQHWQRILDPPLEFALDLFEYNKRWVVMDGYHRLAKHHVLQSNEVPARLHPTKLLDMVKR